MLGLRKNAIRKAAIFFIATLSVGLFSAKTHAVPETNVQLRITVENNQTDANSLAFGPVFFGFHNGSFDPFNVGDPGSETNGGPTPFGSAVINSVNGFGELQSLFSASSPTGGSVEFSNSARGGTTALDGGEFRPRESGDFSVVVDLSQNDQLFILTRVLPSNDAFAATDASLSLANIQQQGFVTFEIFGTVIYDASAENQFRTEADYIADPGSFGDASLDTGRVDFAENIRSNYFGVYDNVILLNGQTFIAPDIGARAFLLGTITIEFITVVAEPAALAMSAFGFVGLFVINYRRRRKQI